MSLTRKMNASIPLAEAPYGSSELEVACDKQSASCRDISSVLAIWIILAMTSVVIFTQPTAVFGNDTLARIGAGGIEFLESTNIKLVEEILKVSQERIKVRYRFHNDATEEIRATVAFPLPVRQYVPRSYREMFLEHWKTIKRSFSIRVNGKPVSTKHHRKAVVADQDVAPLLRLIGLSDKEIFESPPDSEEFKAANYRWKVAEVFSWEQVFPAGKDVIVEHSYAPISSNTSVYWNKDSFGNISGHTSDYFFGRDRCLDQGTRRAISSRVMSYLNKGVERVDGYKKDIEYILGTARNWKGSIGLFKLRIERTAPDQFVSICFPGRAKRITATELEFVKKDFIPADNLVVFFYEIRPK